MKTSAAAREAVVFSDGASSGNPGPAGIGVVLLLDGRKVAFSESIGTATNNVAEYRALIRGLEAAAEYGAETVKVCLDSELIVKQLNGLYRVKNAGLIPLYRKACSLLSKFRKYDISHVRREENSEADSLAKKAVQGSRRAV